MSPAPGKAKLVFREKPTLASGRLQDVVIWKVPVSDSYPEGVRYRLALVDPFTGEIWVLFDNHHPKGHHRHYRDGREVTYPFKSVEKLVNDFLVAVENEMKVYK